ncbi:MAG TPA: methylated-DNA--[protein]-cysteine S-methyltransferase [Capillimicrobium sp.]|jgi:methylated-DNA-[protein]-cysteine S-methyltransferase
MTATIATPLGPFELTASDVGLTRARFAGGDAPAAPAHPPADGPLSEAAAQLEAYFAGGLEAFDLPLDLGGTPFQRAVWDALRAIPYGETTTYRELAARLGRPAAVRAVGAAVGRTPVPVVVPCHRVLGSDGSLTGYIGGLDRKRALLDLEQAGG